MEKDIYEIIKEYKMNVNSNILLKGRIIRNIYANHYLIEVSHYFYLNENSQEFMKIDITRKELKDTILLLEDYFNQFTDKYCVKENINY
ncbi:MAG TPA: hypothetical protein PK199_02740 [Bacteroidales bacterium]|nr:hypothetical protein [Bacteroidales bacterium]